MVSVVVHIRRVPLYSSCPHQPWVFCLGCSFVFPIAPSAVQKPFEAWVHRPSWPSFWTTSRYHFSVAHLLTYLRCLAFSVVGCMPPSFPLLPLKFVHVQQRTFVALRHVLSCLNQVFHLHNFTYPFIPCIVNCTCCKSSQSIVQWS